MTSKEKKEEPKTLSESSFTPSARPATKSSMKSLFVPSASSEAKPAVESRNMLHTKSAGNKESAKPQKKLADGSVEEKKGGDSNQTVKSKTSEKSHDEPELKIPERHSTQSSAQKHAKPVINPTKELQSQIVQSEPTDANQADKSEDSASQQAAMDKIWSKIQAEASTKKIQVSDNEKRSRSIDADSQKLGNIILKGYQKPSSGQTAVPAQNIAVNNSQIKSNQPQPQVTQQMLMQPQSQLQMQLPIQVGDQISMPSNTVPLGNSGPSPNIGNSSDSRIAASGINNDANNNWTKKVTNSLSSRSTKRAKKAKGSAVVGRKKTIIITIVAFLAGIIATIAILIVSGVINPEKDKYSGTDFTDVDAAISYAKAEKSESSKVIWWLEKDTDESDEDNKIEHCQGIIKVTLNYLQKPKKADYQKALECAKYVDANDPTVRSAQDLSEIYYKLGDGDNGESYEEVSSIRQNIEKD